MTHLGPSPSLRLPARRTTVEWTDLARMRGRGVNLLGREEADARHADGSPWYHANNLRKKWFACAMPGEPAQGSPGRTPCLRLVFPDQVDGWPMFSRSATDVSGRPLS